MKFYIINPVDGSNATKCDSFKDLKKVHKIPDSDWDMIKISTIAFFDSRDYNDTYSEFKAFANCFLDAVNKYLNMREFESPYGSYQYTLVVLDKEDYLEI